MFTIYCQLKAAVYHYVTVLCMIYVYPHLPIKCWLVNYVFHFAYLCCLVVPPNTVLHTS